MEVWKPIPGYGGVYYASSSGKIKSVNRLVKRRGGYWREKGKLLKPGIVDGYKRVELYKQGVSKGFSIHYLVLITFVGPRPAEYVCRHLDGDRLNNHFTNLCWGTIQDNSDDKFLHGTLARGESAGTSKLNNEQVTEVRSLAAARVSQTVIAKRFKVTQPAVSYIVNRINWKHIP